MYEVIQTKKNQTKKQSQIIEITFAIHLKGVIILKQIKINFHQVENKVFVNNDKSMFKWNSVLHIGNNRNKYYKNVNWQITRVV